MQELTALMGAMAEGDTAAVFRLQREFGAAIEAAVREALRRRGAVCTGEEIAALGVDVCLMLYDTAAGWSPDRGALPWTWAEKRIGNLVDRHIGQFADQFDEERAELWAANGDGPRPGTSGHEPPVLDVLDRLSAAHPGAQLLSEALTAVATSRDGELFLELHLQELLGDRSPAVTVGALLGLRPDAVRQQHRRVRQRLRQLADSDARFAPLAVLALVA